MCKMDIVIGRSLTIATGNYSSIKPSISITLKDIEEQNITKEYMRLSELADALIALEIIKMGTEMMTISDNGFGAYLRILLKKSEKLENELRKYLEKAPL